MLKTSVLVTDMMAHKKYITKDKAELKKIKTRFALEP